MARKKITEFEGKTLLSNKMSEYEFIGVKINAETDLHKLEKENPRLKKTNLVVKPNHLIGKKGKHNLLLINKDWEEAKKHIKHNLGKEIEIGKTKGKLEMFLVEPFVEHKEEYYLSILTERDNDKFMFSLEGGVDIESNWEKVISFEIPAGETASAEEIEKKLPKELEESKKSKLAGFISELHKFFIEQNCSYLETNPLAFNKEEKLIPLGFVCELDRCADFKHYEDWKEITFSGSFGKNLTKEEEFIRQIDSESGASLKLTILNPKGKIWTLVAGGGASVIYTDTVADLGKGNELANYGEYSGNPTTSETYQYAKTVLDLLTRDGKEKILLIGGGVANFTDVANTFKGIIMAIREYADKLRKNKVKIYIRRGGPNYEEGLRLMKELGEELKIPMEIYGPETHMTKIVSIALKNK